MGTMRYKPSDRVKIKSLDWYNENKNSVDNYDVVFANGWVFSKPMSNFCGKELIIEKISHATNPPHYIMKDTMFAWTDEMIEGLVEEENNDCEKCGLTRMSTRCLFMDNCPHNKQKNIIEIPKDYVLKDENGNVINATKIVLEKKKKEYPKTFEECVHVLEGENRMSLEQMNTFRKLIDARNAYWKIAGEEMGLGKPWEPDWNNVSDKYCIYFVSGYAWSKECQTRQCPFAFPTPEMRDAFKENFDPDIEICKEFL